MKRVFGFLIVGILAATLAMFAQNGNAPSQPGQGNPPQAVCDKDGDGLCDYTGLPVGQCRQANCPGCNGNCPRGNGQGQGQRRGSGPGSTSCPRAAANAQRAAAAQK